MLIYKDFYILRHKTQRNKRKNKYLFYENISIAQKQRHRDYKHPMLGKKHSKETKLRITKQASNRIWINNNIEEKLVFVENISEFINLGWVKGRKLKTIT
jgi:hypothetical protein